MQTWIIQSLVHFSNLPSNSNSDEQNRKDHQQRLNPKGKLGSSAHHSGQSVYFFIILENLYVFFGGWIEYQQYLPIGKWRLGLSDHVLLCFIGYSCFRDFQLPETKSENQ